MFHVSIEVFNFKCCLYTLLKGYKFSDVHE